MSVFTQYLTVSIHLEIGHSHMYFRTYQFLPKSLWDHGDRGNQFGENRLLIQSLLKP